MKAYKGDGPGRRASPFYPTREGLEAFVSGAGNPGDWAIIPVTIPAK